MRSWINMGIGAILCGVAGGAVLAELYRTPEYLHRPSAAPMVGTVTGSLEHRTLGNDLFLYSVSDGTQKIFACYGDANVEALRKRIIIGEAIAVSTQRRQAELENVYRGCPEDLITTR